MGGKGSGGARPNSGPKRRDANASWLAGEKRARPRAVPRPDKPFEAASATIKKPKGLAEEVSVIWDEYAPVAIARGSLDQWMVPAFVRWCAIVAMERRMAMAPLAAGGPDHRGMMQRVEAGLTRFRLWPDGKPVVADEPVKDEWDEFDGHGPRLVPKQA